MRTRAREGFTLVEMLVVSVMLTLVMGAVYQTLISQQQSTRHLSAVINTQQTNRTSAQFLASELREVGTRLAGDITSATSTQVTVRAMRKIGFVCRVTGSNTLDVYTLGDSAFAGGDLIAVYADKNTQSMKDDSVLFLTVNGNPGTGTSAATCPGAGAGSGPWSQLGYTGQSLNVTASTSLASISVGAAIRSYVTVTYGAFSKGSDLVFGRQLSGDTAVVLIGPLASGVGIQGFQLQYYDGSGNEIPTPVGAGSIGSIARIRITVRGLGKGAVSKSGTYSVPLVTDVSLRGN